MNRDEFDLITDAIAAFKHLVAKLEGKTDRKSVYKRDSYDRVVELLEAALHEKASIDFVEKH